MAEKLLCYVHIFNRLVISICVGSFLYVSYPIEELRFFLGILASTFIFYYLMDLNKYPDKKNGRN